MNRILAAVAAVVAGLSGCASPARYVEQGPDSGVVAIPANTNTWPTYYQHEAQALIEKHVGPNFEVVHQEAVAVGTRTNNNQQVQREKTFNTSMPFMPAEKDTVSNVTTTSDITEWRITYRRKAGVPGANGVSPAGGTVQTQYQSAGGATGVVPAGGVVPGVGPVGATTTTSPWAGLTSQAASCPDCAAKAGASVQADAGMYTMPKK